MDMPVTKMPDDIELIRVASGVARDLAKANPVIFWGDFLASAIIGYSALAVAISVQGLWLALFAALVSVLALYRAGSFIHELTHLKDGAVPGFHWGWNILLGIPLFIPSFMYEGTHVQHHARTKYGTAADPEYLPLAHMKRWQLVGFAMLAALGPVGLLIRYGVLAPLSLVIPPIRRLNIARFSTLAINPEYRRKPPEGEFRIWWLKLGVLTATWAMALLALTATGTIPLRAFLIFLGIASATMFINQIRTLVAHLWSNDGEAMSVTAQYLDSVNVPPPNKLSALWAPVGLRYHAIHHLMPSVPYHALGEAHRRLVKALPAESPYHRANFSGMAKPVMQIFRGAVG
jgi:fatty acid desaturase